jgi:hypothetical protein
MTGPLSTSASFMVRLCPSQVTVTKNSVGEANHGFLDYFQEETGI